MAIDIIRSTQFNSGSPGENHQQTPEEEARNTLKSHQYRTVWKEQQTTTPFILTGGWVQDSQYKTGANVRTNLSVTQGLYLEQAESPLKHKDIVGMTAVGRQCIGATRTLLWSRSDQKERRAMIQSEVWRAEEHVRQAIAEKMRSHGACTTWNTADRKLTWGDIWKYEPLRLSFRIRSVYDLLLSPANLSRWGLGDDPKCSLCDRSGTLEHVLSSCSKSLTHGRFRLLTWRSP